MEWLTIISMALNLMNTVQCNEAYRIELKWEKPQIFQMNTQNNDNILVVDIRLKEGSMPLKKLILIPWKDVYYSQNKNNPIGAQLSVFTITREVMVFEIPQSGYEQNSASSALQKSINDFFEYKKNSTQLDKFTSIPDSYQILDFKEYPNFVTLSIAKPGSKQVNPTEIAYLFPNKMIQLNIIPDYGKINSSWIKGGHREIPKVITNIFFSSLEKALKESNAENRQLIYKRALEDLRKESAGIYYESLLSKMLFIDNSVDEPAIENIFGDYQPKLSPDNAVDFMPDILPDVESLPSPNLENLKVLADLFFKHQVLVQQNPGEWVEGNLILGAQPKEYIPTKEELILDEIGERINFIIKQFALKKIKKTLLKKGFWKKEFCYTHFTFIHYDVMGSGRFFYIDTMEKRCFKLKN
ncbi:MAG: hypothetical protein HQ541_23795 [Mariniphaga sp.]|nr:hypothetical protein [Mariniphaga sp.]